MHAPPDRGPQIGKRAAAALVAAVVTGLVGCSGGGSDSPALNAPSTTPSSAATNGGSAGAPAITVVRVGSAPVPQVAGQPAVNASLHALGTALPAGCQEATERDDRRLVSFRWVCGTHPVTATYDLATGRRLGLADLFAGGYHAYLQATAQAQLEANGATDPPASDLSAWWLTPSALQVAFPTGVVSFPLSTLAPYLRRPGPLSP